MSTHSLPTVLDNRPVFDATVPGFSEAYYVIWTDPAKKRSMVVRYVLFNGPTDGTKIAEVWCWYRDQVNGDDFAVRQRYPLAAVRIAPGQFRLEIGTSSGLTESRAWGAVEDQGRVISWDFDMPVAKAQAVDRLKGAGNSVLFPRFYSSGCKRTISARVVFDGREIQADAVEATDGHYWNTHQLRTWSWANGVRFREDPSAFLEAIAFRLYADDAPMAVSVAFGSAGWTWQNDALEAMYLNRELETELERWRVSACFGQQRVEAVVTGNPDDMILITHPLPNGAFLYTTITLNAQIQIQVVEGCGADEKVVRTLTSDGGASFEVTKPVRNPRVTREFKIVSAPARLIGA